MGREEHYGDNYEVRKKADSQHTDGIDVEFSEEFADSDDKKAQARSRAADHRAHKDK